MPATLCSPKFSALAQLRQQTEDDVAMFERAIQDADPDNVTQLIFLQADLQRTLKRKAALDTYTHSAG